MKFTARGAAQLEQLLCLQRTLARAHAEMQRHQLQRDTVGDDVSLEHDAGSETSQRNVVRVLLDDRPAR